MDHRLYCQNQPNPINHVLSSCSVVVCNAVSIYSSSNNNNKMKKKMMMIKRANNEKDEEKPTTATTTLNNEEEHEETAMTKNANRTKITKKEVVDLGNGSQVVYMPKFLSWEESWSFFRYLDSHIPWTRPTIRVFGRSCLQPRDTCYVASKGLPDLVYSGYQPHAYHWDDFPPLKDLLELVHKALPQSSFNSLLLNRYKGGNDYVGWHADDEKLYGPTPEIASVSFGCDRDFLLKKKPSKASSHGRSSDGESASKRAKKSSSVDQHAFELKHGSLLVMRGYTQRDWLHSVPKRVKAEATRVNLTFRYVR